MGELFDEIVHRNLELRDYQSKHNQAVKESALKGNRRIISCMSTGAGKSAMIADLAKTALSKMKRVVIILPRRSLVRQLSKSFHEWGINHGVVMSKVGRFTLPRCQIVSIDTYMSRLASGKMSFIDADFAIIDELQLQWSKKKLAIFGKYKMVVAFSATPVAPKGESLGNFYDDIVKTINMEELMEQEHLTPLKYYADPNIDLSNVKVGKDGDWMESQLGEAMDKPVLTGNIFDNWLRITCGTKPTVCFASSQAHARHLCDIFNKNGYVFEYIDCETKDEDREMIFARVASGETIGLCNVGIVSVGIDIPNLEVVILARPTKLICVYLQCCGRATRKSPGKEFGIIIDHAGIIERLGFASDDFEWSLDGKESIEERMKKKKEEKKEPREIVCVCGYVFKSARACPKCGMQLVKAGQPVPYYEAELKEITVKKEKYSEAYKQDFFEQMIGYARRNSKSDYWAINQYESRFKETPKWEKKGTEPGQEVANWIKHINIRNAYSKRKNAA
jgi:superfamily II DNA or RNA helicase